MTSRITGLLALVGGAAWVVKVALIWENGGTNTTEGLVGSLFTVGARRSASSWWRWAPWSWA